MDIAAIILAAGNASRFGRNKLLVSFRSKPIIEHVIDTVVQFPFTFIAVVSRYPEVRAVTAVKSENDSSWERKRIKYVENLEADMGQSASIRKGILAAPLCDGYLFWPGDQPLVSPQTVETLCQTFKEMPQHIIIPKYDGIPGSPRIFPVKYREALLSLTGDEGGRTIVKRATGISYVSVDNKEENIDIDIPSDLEQLL